MAMLMASRFNSEAKIASRFLSTLLRNQRVTASSSSSMASASSSSALLLNPLTSSTLRHFRSSPEISSLSFSASGFPLGMKSQQSRSYGDVSKRDPCEAVKLETGADGLNIAQNVSQVKWASLFRSQVDKLMIKLAS